MKTFTLPAAEFSIPGGMPVTAKQVLKSVLEADRVNGMTVAEMRARLTILNAIDAAAAGAAVQLEDADYERLKGIIAKHPFPVVAQGILDLVDVIDQAKTVASPAAKK